MTTILEADQHQIDELSTHLYDRFGSVVKREVIDQAAAQAFARFRHAPVQNFVSVLAERSAVDALRLTASMSHAPTADSLAV